MPDYDLYTNYVNKKISEGSSRTKFADYLDYSIGFTTRGCFRKCSFCVNKKYDHAFKHSPVSEFLNEDKPFIYLWDDNIMAYGGWKEILDDLEVTGKPFQFRQGIDLRLMTDEKARRLSQTRYQGDFIFAFDHLSDRDIIIDKVQLWKRYTSKVCKMYVLSAYEAQDETNIADVFERIKILMKYGSLPYIMRHENYKKSPFKSIYIELARWCNQPQFFKKKSFREFCEANQEYKKNKETNCSAYQAMLDFEEQFPEIAKEYFDLKFENENVYKKQYGYGRRFANKTSCAECKKRGNCWLTLLSDDSKKDEIVSKYLTKEIDLQCLIYDNSECKKYTETIVNKLVDILLKMEIDHIVDLLKVADNREEVTAENIPQYSDLTTAMYLVPEFPAFFDERITYDCLGQFILSGEKQKIADKKYGENHGKLAALLDLLCISKDSKSAYIEQSLLGKKFLELSENEKNNILPKLVLRIPIIQNAIISDNAEESITKDMEILAQTTRKRRESNVKQLLEYVIGE